MTNRYCKNLKNTLFNSIDHIALNKEKYLVNPATDFSRTQKISFCDTMLFPIVTSDKSVPVEMLDFFKTSALPSQAALSYRRNQLNFSAFQDLFYHFSNALPQNKTFRGMRLIACDGSRINTPYNPNDTDSFADCVEGKKGFNQYHVNTCYDILNDIYTDAVIQGYHSRNEQLAFCQMIDRYPKDGDILFIADRGYSSYNVIAHLINNEHHFLIRLSPSMGNHVFDIQKDLKYSDQYDIEGIIQVGRTANKESKSRQNYHRIHNYIRYDYIPVKSLHIDQFTVRLVRFRLSDGTYEYLITDLPKSSFTMSDLMNLYHARWGVETSFRHLKYAAEMIHIHSLKLPFYLQHPLLRWHHQKHRGATQNIIQG